MHDVAQSAPWLVNALPASCGCEKATEDCSGQIHITSEKQVRARASRFLKLHAVGIDFERNHRTEANGRILRLIIEQHTFVVRTRANQSVDGRRALNPDTVLGLEMLFGMPADFWLTRQLRWDLYQAKH